MWPIVRAEMKYNIYLLLYETLIVVAIISLLLFGVIGAEKTDEGDLLPLIGLILFFSIMTAVLGVLTWHSNYRQEKRNLLLVSLPLTPKQRETAIRASLILNYVPSIVIVWMLILILFTSGLEIPFLLAPNLIALVFMVVSLVSALREVINSSSKRIVNLLTMIPMFFGFLFLSIFLELETEIPVLYSVWFLLGALFIGIISLLFTARSLSKRIR